jgi:hypothetical protein
MELQVFGEDFHGFFPFPHSNGIARTPKEYHSPHAAGAHGNINQRENSQRGLAARV